MAVWSRSKAMLTMSSPLGPDVLIPISLAAHEGISRLFAFNVNAVCQTGVINPDDLLFQPAALALQDNDGTVLRHFHGIVQQISAEGPVRGVTGASDFESYRIVLVPKLWFLDQTVDCRVYQKMSVATSSARCSAIWG